MEGHTVTSRPVSIDEGTPSPPVPHTAHALYGLVIQFLAGQSLVHKSGRATAGRESRVLRRRLMWSVMAGGEGRGGEERGRQIGLKHARAMALRSTEYSRKKRGEGDLGTGPRPADLMGMDESPWDR
jgi:hypothetical protein